MVVSGMIIVQMAEDDHLDIVGIRSDLAHRFARADQILPRPGFRHVRGKASIDDDRARSVTHQPHVIGHLHRSVMRVAADETFRALPHRTPVSDRVDFVVIHPIIPVHRVRPPSRVIVVPVT